MLRTASRLLLLWPTLTFAGVAGHLEGRVTDAGGDPLIGANVIVVEAEQGTTTDTLGRYSLHNIRAGTYTVRISMVGYRAVTTSAVRILPDRRAELSVQLQDSPFEMEAVEVVLEKPLIERDITGTVYRVDAGGLIDLPVDSYEDVVALQPATTVEGNIRGGKARETIYLVDGLPVQDVVQGGAGTELPLSAISQMTVQTGGFDAEYGDAMSGVINIISRGGGSEHEIAVRAAKDDLAGGDEVSHRNELEVTASGPLGDDASYFTASRLQLTDTRWWQDLELFFDSPVRREWHGLAKADSRRLGPGKLTAELIYSLQRWRDYEFSWRYNLNGLPPRRRDSYRAALLWTHAPTTTTAVSASVSMFSLHTKIGSGSAADIDLTPFDYDFFLLYVTSGSRSWWADQRQLSYTAKADVSHQHERHILKAGAELIQYDIDADLVRLEPQTTFFGRPLVFEPQLNYSTRYHYLPRKGSAYVQDRIEAPNRTVLSFGVRLDFLDPRAERPAVELVPTSPDEYQEQVVGSVPAKVKVHVSPRLGASFPFSERSVFFVNFGDYVQFPLFDFLYSGLENVNLRDGVNVLRGNPDLLAEKTRAWEVSLRYELSEDIVGSATYFRKETTDQIDSKTFVPSNSRIAGDYGFSEYVNNPTASARGFEFLLSRPRGAVRGNLLYALMRTEGLSEYGDQGLNLAQWGFPVASTPFPLSWDQRHTLKADITLELPDGLQFDFVWQFHSGRPYTFYPSEDGFTADDPERPFIPNNRRMDDYSLLNLKVRRPLPMWWGVGLTAYIDARNVTDARNVRWVDSSGRVGGELEDPSAFYPSRRTILGLRFEL
jgi:outer membrane receptor protein involved in Fe transport